MGNTFIIMNLLLKGNSEAIKNAIIELETNSFDDFDVIYDPFKVTDDSSVIDVDKIVEVGLYYYGGKCVSADELPINSMKEIKYIGLGDGCYTVEYPDGRKSERFDGSYVFFKDFGDTNVTACYKFSFVGPHLEAFDRQFDVVNNVHGSFMDHTWEFEFECEGEEDYWSFNSDEDIALVEKWKNDESYNNDIIPAKKIEMVEIKNDETIDNPGFEIEDGILIKYYGDEKEVIIPDGVKGINEDAFFACRFITRVDIPKSVEFIGPYAFHSCTNLQQVDFSEGIRIIDEFAFDECDSLIQIIIPRGTKEIKEGAFLECANLEKVELPEGLKEIGPAAFSTCKKLKTINIPESVERIGNYAFDYCTSLVDLKIKMDDIILGEKVFRGCKKLKNKM